MQTNTIHTSQTTQHDIEQLKYKFNQLTKQNANLKKLLNDQSIEKQTIHNNVCKQLSKLDEENEFLRKISQHFIKIRWINSLNISIFKSNSY